MPHRGEEMTKHNEKNDEAPMTNDEGSTNVQMTNRTSQSSTRNSDFVIPSSFNASPARTIRHSSLSEILIASATVLADQLTLIECNSGVAVDTEADNQIRYLGK